MSAREYIRVTPEAVPGTFDVAADPIIIDLDSANAYTMRPQPMSQDLRTAGACNRRWGRISKKTQYTGNLNWNVRGSQAALLADWCVAVADVLKSYTIDHVIVMEDSGSTEVYSRILGVYVQQAQLSAGEQDQWFKAALQLVGMKKAAITVADFAKPDYTDYPSDQFLTFEDATGGLTLHAATRLDIENFQVTIKNLLDVRFFVGSEPQKIKWCGCDVDWTSRLSYSSAVPRADYESQAPVTGSITFNNGTNSLAFDMQTQNYYSQLADQLDFSKIYLQEITMQSHLDPAAGTDFEITAT